MKSLLLIVALSVLSSATHAEWMSDEQAIMGTAIRVELLADDAEAGRAAIEAVMAEMRRIDATMSPFKPESELSRVNREAAKHPVKISREFFDLIITANHWSEVTGGAFDITFASVGRYYDYRKGEHPSDTKIAANLPRINYRHVVLDAAHQTVRFTMAGTVIDLGGIAKGHAVDRCIALLKERGIRQAMVMAGGDTFVLGDRGGRPWSMGIRDPRDHEKVAVMLPLTDAAISTSGDYERYFIAEGVRYHHILNPRTGRSANGMRSATIIGPDATTTDALSTSVFVMGADRGLALIESLQEVQAVVITDDGTMRFTSGLESK